MTPQPERPGTLARSRSNFLTRTAQDVARQLDRRFSAFPGTPSPSRDDTEPLLQHRAGPSEARDSLVSADRSLLSASPPDGRTASDPDPGPGGLLGRIFKLRTPSSRQNGATSKPKPSSGPRPVAAPSKLGTFAGVFVPTTLNVLSILMFLRFGFILGQAGLLGFLGMLFACYLINVVTTMSLSAIATNGTVRGGGAYFLISRSLGPEFGGSIGIVFYLGFIFNTGMNAVGLVDCFSNNFGSSRGNWANWLPEGYWWNYLWGTAVLLLCTIICLAGSGLFARASNGLLLLLLVATFSIPFSALLLKPFDDQKLGIHYTGPSLKTLVGNLYPRFTKGADGSQLHSRETWQDLFGILFPATGGIFAGASMSGDLKHPSKAIPKGTLYGLGLTFIAYTLVIITMASTITRATFYHNVNIVQDVNVSGVVILLGEFSTSFFSTLMGVIGSAKLLQALARDNLFPGLSWFAQGTKAKDEPTYAIIITYLLAQLTMLSDINQIASFVTMTYLMTFLVMNLACFLLKISSAPNFRPSFRYFNWATAFTGTVLSGAMMFFVDGAYASGCMLLLAMLFLVAHYTTAPKSWGDVSQSLIYHQVRKYLLRLRQEHVKFWRPQILLFINDPRRQYKLIQFCNSLKKGSLYILGHVIVNDDFGDAVPEAKKQQQAWAKYIDFSRIKAFVNIAISPSVEWGSRNIVLNAGLGGMRPNIVMMGFFNLDGRRTTDQVHTATPERSTAPQPPDTHTKQEADTMAQSHHPQTVASSAHEASKRIRRRGKSQTNKAPLILPTDANRAEHPVTASSYVTVLEDLLLRLQVNVALAKGFQNMDLPSPLGSRMDRLKHWVGLNVDTGSADEDSRQYIDLWPIQMSAEIAAEGSFGHEGKSVLTTNFDTYTLILQLGCILTTVPSWKRTHKLRIVVFVEYEADVEEERGRVQTLLNNLRIEGDVLVFWLACGDLRTYEVIVNGKSGPEYNDVREEVSAELKDETWWSEVQTLRAKVANATQSSGMRDMAEIAGLLQSAENWPGASFQQGRQDKPAKRFRGLKKMIRRTRRRTSMGGISQLGVNFGIRTSRLDSRLVDDYNDSHSSNESSASESDDTYHSRASPRPRSIADSHTAPVSSDAEETSIEIAASENDASSSDGAQPLTPRRRAFSSSAETENRPKTPLRLQGTRTPTAIAERQQLSAPEGQARSSMSDHAYSDGEAERKDAFAASRRRPPMIRQQSAPKFTSKPVPRTKVAQSEGPGPSIMFADQPSPEQVRSDHPGRSERSGEQQAGRGANPEGDYMSAGIPSSHLVASAVPLSFNDLPCRAQHLILNELMRAVSPASSFRTSESASPPPTTQTPLAKTDPARYTAMIAAAMGRMWHRSPAARDGKEPTTAVVFTTLPSPVPGTGRSEEDSLRYLMDLEVLCKGLPPCLFVHSNSISVTMSL